MANIIGIKRSTYASYETCRDTIPLKHLNTLCNYFNISLDYALGLTDIKRYDNELDAINIKIAGCFPSFFGSIIFVFIIIKGNHQINR